MTVEATASGDHGASGHGSGGESLHAHPPHKERPQWRGWKGWALGIIGGIITIIIGLVFVTAGGWVGSRFFAISHLEDEVAHLKENTETKAEASLVQNELNTDLAEIAALRQSASNFSALLSSATGKYDTMINKHEAEVAFLRGKVDALTEKVAKLEVHETNSNEELKLLKDAKIEKLSAEVTSLRERIASLEATVKSLEPRK